MPKRPSTRRDGPASRWALGYNRRFHPEMTKLREHDPRRRARHDPPRRSDDDVSQRAARSSRLSGARTATETPCGGLTPMGVHAVDGMIDLCGTIDHVFCQSFRRVVEIDADDTTSMLFRMKDGMSGYLGTMTATGPGFSFQVFGSKGWVRLEGMTHVAGASSERAAHAPVRHLQVPAGEGREQRFGEAATPRCHASRARRLRPGGQRRSRIPDPDRSDGSRRRPSPKRSCDRRCRDAPKTRNAQCQCKSNAR